MYMYLGEKIILCCIDCFNKLDSHRAKYSSLTVYIGNRAACIYMYMYMYMSIEHYSTQTWKKKMNETKHNN